MMTINLENPWYAFLFLILVIIVWLYIELRKWRIKAINSFADFNLQENVFGKSVQKGISIKYISLMASLFFIIIAFMGPLWGEEKQILKREGIDLVFALDLSNSMNAEDVAPSRLEKSKQLINSYIKKLGGDRVGLVVFAGLAYRISPLTSDYFALESYINTLNTEFLWGQGTDFGRAIETSIKAIGKAPDTSKAIVIISDGEDHLDDYDDAIKLAKDNKVEIFTIGVGGTAAVPIPMKDSELGISYKKDKDGKTVLTTFQGETLRNIAQKSGGAYIKMNTINQTLAKLKDNIANLQKKSMSETSTINKKQQFQWFLGIGILLFFIFILTPEKKNIRI